MFYRYTLTDYNLPHRHKQPLLNHETGKGRGPKGNNKQNTVKAQSPLPKSETQTQAQPHKAATKKMPMAVPLHILRNLNSLPPLPLLNVPAPMPMPVPVVFNPPITPQTQPRPRCALSKADQAAMEELALCVQAPETQPRSIDVRTVYRCIQIMKSEQMMHTQPMPRLE